MLLDRDYYPVEYLDKVKTELEAEGITTVFTFGKEIENIYLNQSFLSGLMPVELEERFLSYTEDLFSELYYDCLGSHQKLHKEYYKGMDEKTIVKTFNPVFDRAWSDNHERYYKVAGKEMLKKIRDFFQRELKKTLTDDYLLDALLKVKRTELELFVREIFQK